MSRPSPEAAAGAAATAGLTTSDLLDIKDHVARTARELGRWAQDQSARHHRGEDGVEVGTKTSPGDMVTSVDLHVQERLVQELTAAYPTFGFLGEEAHLSHFDDTNPVWIIDPVDGTHNFVRAYPGFCVSVGLVHGGESLVGVIYDAATARDLEAAFLRDMESCEEFTVEGYRQRSPLLRFRDSVARLFSPLL